MTLALTASKGRPIGAWPGHGGALLSVAALIVSLFYRDAHALVRIWWTSTTFGHCLFIGPVIAWLVWQRRAQLARLTPAAWWPGLALVAVGGAGWLMGEAATVSFARQLGLIVMLQGAVVTLLGPQVARGLLFPLAYALFLVPMGEGLETPLQNVTVAMVMPMLRAVGVPASVDGVLIHAGRYYFEVAEACSGAKFVIAMIAFGVLVANVCFVSWRRRAMFLAVSLIVPVLANGVRAFATIWAAQLTSLEAATGFDHIVYGWVFFGLVMAAVLGIAWRWFDRAPDAPAFDPVALDRPVGHRIDLGLAALLVLATAAIFPAWSGAVAARAQALPSHIDLPDVTGWHRAFLSTRAPWEPFHPGADHHLFGRYADDRGDAVDVAIAVYGAQAQGRELVGFGTGVLREEDRWVRIADMPPIDGGSAMRITAPGPGRQAVERIVATWYRVGDVTTHDERLVKVATMRARLFGGPQRAVAVHLSAEVLPGHDPVAAIRAFRVALGPIDALADRSAGMR